MLISNGKTSCISKHFTFKAFHFFPRDLKFWGAILTAIITIFAAGFSAYSEMLPDGDPLKFAFGFVALMVLFTGAILACISTILQKQ